MQNWKGAIRMGLETGTNKNKTDGGLTISNGLSDSNTFVKLLSKRRTNSVQGNTSWKHQRNYQPGLKTTKATPYLGRGWAGMHAYVCGQKRRRTDCGWICHRQSCGHMHYRRDGAFLGREESFPPEMLALSRDPWIPVAGWCPQLIPFGVKGLLVLLLRVT